MKTRIIAGVPAAILLVWLIVAGSQGWMMLTILGCSFVAGYEFEKMFFPNHDWVRRLRVSVPVVITLFMMWYSMNAGWMSFFSFCSFFVVYRVVQSDRRADFASSVRDLSVEMLGYWYLVALFGFLMPIVRIAENGRSLLLLLFLVVFVGDTAAYFFGLKFGKHRLASDLSPKKSVEGALAAVFSSVLVASGWLLVTKAHLGREGYFIRIMFAAPILSVLAQLGDLFESMLKRSQATKDSGSFLPGHGGILDRVDGLALAAPAFYFFLSLVLES